MIPTYRQADIVLEAIDSALGQDYENLEVVVADDASPDQTSVVVSTRVDPRLRYWCNEKNLGRVGNYRNTLYNLAQGEWVVNLDGDDVYIDKKFISSAIELIQRDPAIVMVVGRRVMSMEGTVKLVSRLPKAKILDGWDVVFGMPNPDFHFSHMATLYKAELAREIDFYRMDLISADWESLYRLALRGKVAYLDRIVGEWRVGKFSASQSGDLSARLDNLAIWDSIVSEAQGLGAPSYHLTSLKRRCLNYFAFVAFDDVLRVAGPLESVRYLQGLWQRNPGALLTILLNWRTFPKWAFYALRQCSRFMKDRIARKF